MLQFISLDEGDLIKGQIEYIYIKELDAIKYLEID